MISKNVVSISAAIALSASLLAGTALPVQAKTIHPQTTASELTVKSPSNYSLKAERSQYVVQVKNGYDVYKLAAEVDGKVNKELSIIDGGFLLEIPSNKEEEFKGLAGVVKAAKTQHVEPSSIKIGGDIGAGQKAVKANTHRQLIGSDRLKFTGKGVTVAVLDSGMNSLEINKVTTKTNVSINPESTTPFDNYGHGTHVAGIIKGNDTTLGVAPAAEIINVKLGNDQGMLTEVDLLLGLQWVFDNKDLYNIKVVNLSVSSTTAQSYLDSPLSAAVEQLWLNGITVVTAAGNSLSNTENVNFPPANDPFVITVGALNGSDKTSPSTVEKAAWSRKGITPENITKPEVNAPGVDITSYVPTDIAMLPRLFPNSVTDGKFMTMSGTSMAAPVVTGAVALLLEANPSLTPNQIKYLLTVTAGSTATSGSPIINVKQAITYAQDSKYMESLNLSAYNSWTKSSYMDSVDNTVDYSKASWRTLDWLKASWRSVDWAKASWRSHWDNLGN